jgi:hypothetical protein
MTSAPLTSPPDVAIASVARQPDGNGPGSQQRWPPHGLHNLIAGSGLCSAYASTSGVPAVPRPPRHTRVPGGARTSATDLLRRDRCVGEGESHAASSTLRCSPGTQEEEQGQPRLGYDESAPNDALNGPPPHQERARVLLKPGTAIGALPRAEPGAVIMSGAWSSRSRPSAFGTRRSAMRCIRSMKVDSDWE